MSEPIIRDCTDSATWWPHVAEAVQILARGSLAVIPTDTVYGLAADAFRAKAVRTLLIAKARSRRKPPPVLIGDVRTMEGLATEIPDSVRALTERFWPGALTIILKAQPTVRWDLGETRGTVALRMPDDEFTLTLLRKTGPLAVSSANLTGRAPAQTAAEAAEQLGTAVSLYLDGGPAKQGLASTIIDATGERLRIVREGALTRAELAEVVPELLEDPPEHDAGQAAPEAGADDDAAKGSDPPSAAADGPPADGADESGASQAGADESAAPESGADGDAPEASDPPSADADSSPPPPAGP